MGTAKRWTKARRVWLRSRAKDTQGKVGQFCEHLMAAILGCEISNLGNPEYADIYSRDIQIRVEVKGRGSINSFELRQAQITEYTKAAFPFPIQHTLYALVPYKSATHLNKNSPRPRNFSEKTSMLSLLRSAKSNTELCNFLAKNIETSYLLDLEIVKALRKYLGARSCGIILRGEEKAVRISRTVLRELFEDDHLSSTLDKLGLKPQAWAKGVYPIRVSFKLSGHEYTTELTLVTIVHRRANSLIASQLSRVLMRV